MYEENQAEINFGLKDSVRFDYYRELTVFLIYVLQTTGCGFVREKIRESRELQKSR